MRKSMKKVAALVLTLAMSTALLAACGNKGETVDSKKDPTIAPTKAAENSQGTTDPTKAPEGGFKDYSKGFEKNVTIQIPVYDRAFEGWNPTNNYYTQWVQKEFGDKYNVKVEFVAIGRSTEVTDFNQMLAAGTAPDIIFHYDMPQAIAYYDEGAMQELNYDEIANYAPTYYKNLGSTIDSYGTINGEKVFFFASRPTAYNWVTLIRQDWIDKVGKAMPANLTELNELYAAWRDAGLGNGGGALVQNNFTYDYFFRSWPIDSDERALYSDLSVAALPWEATHKFLKNLNYQYNNNLIDKEFYLNTDDASTKADFVSGNSGVYSLYLSSSTDVMTSLLANNPDAKVSLLPMAANVPEGGVPQQRGYWPFGMIMGINSTTPEEERVAVWMYLEWLSQPENLFFFQNGVEGANYTLDAAGLAVKNADFTGESKLSNNNNKDYWCLVVESAQYADEDLNFKANIANWAPAGYEYIIEDAYKDFVDNLEYMTPDAIFLDTIESVAEYKSDLNDLWKELYVQCAMASEADFEAVYKKACEEYLAAGYQTILDDKQAAISAGGYN